MWELIFFYLGAGVFHAADSNSLTPSTWSERLQDVFTWPYALWIAYKP